jgi:hypothetical protein
VQGEVPDHRVAVCTRRRGRPPQPPGTRAPVARMAAGQMRS